MHRRAISPSSPRGSTGCCPVWLKHLSVTFYVKPLCPVELPIEGISGFFTVVAEPTLPWLAVSGLLAFVLLVVTVACWHIRTRDQLQHGLISALLAQPGLFDSAQGGLVGAPKFPSKPARTLPAPLPQTDPGRGGPPHDPRLTSPRLAA